MLVLVFGIPGVGKTTVLNHLKERKPEIEIGRIGTFIFEKAKEQGLVETRDDLRKLPIEKQTELQSIVYDHINELRTHHEYYLLDTHAAIKTNVGYWPTFHDESLEYLKPDAFVLIEVEPEAIFRRRVKDPSRNRDEESLMEIEQHQMIDRAFAAAYSTITNGIILIVQNEEGKPQDAAEKIVRLFDS
jgi:adenylate kinase